ncbi:MAG: RNase H1/viroplasmin domain-containing protein, partial [Bacteroidales bacterium]|nr:RNase H1/viroplasmin domain-containing protein [Bacteroidales bacterium]
MAKKTKYYVVWKGRTTGIFDNWDECKFSVLEYEGAKYKSFDTLHQAQEAYNRGFESYLFKKKEQLPKQTVLTSHLPIIDSIATDAACSG